MKPKVIKAWGLVKDGALAADGGRPMLWMTRAFARLYREPGESVAPVELTIRILSNRKAR